jgi:hypothetical protein
VALNSVGSDFGQQIFQVAANLADLAVGLQGVGLSKAEKPEVVVATSGQDVVPGRRRRDEELQPYRSVLVDHPGVDPRFAVDVVDVGVEGQFGRCAGSCVALGHIAVGACRYEVEGVHAQGGVATLGHEVVELADRPVAAQRASLVLWGAHQLVVDGAAGTADHAVLVEPGDDLLALADAGDLEVLGFEGVQRLIEGRGPELVS